MKTRTPLYAVACLLLCSFPGVAQEKGYWRASSKTAQSITGDVTISEYKVAIDLSSFTIAQIRDLKPDEASAAFGEGATGGSGNLYRLSIPAAKRFLHKNSLCGSEDTQWMVTYVAGRDLQIAFFSGGAMPVFTADAIANSTNLCGTFSYVRRSAQSVAERRRRGSRLSCRRVDLTLI